MAARPLLGVLGGMGPGATADFLAKLIRATPATTDQDHVPVIACSIPQIPDRTAAILHEGPSPLPALTSSLSVLLRSGASLVAMPCNTAHRWHADLQARSHAPILHIVDAVGSALRSHGLERSRVGLLATTATVQAGIFQTRLEAEGIGLTTPDPEGQSNVMAAIRLAKAGRLSEAADVLRPCVDALGRRGVAAIILGCTELPLLRLPEGPIYIDSTLELARSAIDRHRDLMGGRVAP